MSFILWGIVFIAVGLRWGMSPSSSKVKSWIISAERSIRSKLR